REDRGARRAVSREPRAPDGALSRVSALEGWDNFYVIVGSSAGALIGLQFVVVTLIAEGPVGRAEAPAGGAVAAPSGAHFGAVLLLASLVSAPWSGIGTVAVLWGVVGLCGLAYSVLVARRMRAQTAYRPVLEDWLFHALLPVAAYAALALATFV